MASEQRFEDRITPAQAELGCFMVLIALWWPFAGSCVVAYSVLVSKVESPFLGTWFIGFVPSLIVYLMLGRTLSYSLSPEQKNNWRAALYVCLRSIFPFFFAILFLDLAGRCFLEFVWERQSSNRYLIVMASTLVVSLVSTTCAYFFWRLLRSPLYSPKRNDDKEGQ
jgi:hypothetical protein